MIIIENLEIKYPDGNTSIKSISLKINKGESVALIGANGAGKSTLLKTLVGVIPINKGSIKVEGINLSRSTISSIRKKVGMVFQNPDDQLFMTHVFEDIAFGPRNFGVKEEEVINRVKKTMSLLEIAHLAKRPPTKLSGGEKRMVAIAGVLAMDPVLMLFDEPTSFLDPKSTRNLIKILKKINVTKVIAATDINLVK